MRSKSGRPLRRTSHVRVFGQSGTSAQHVNAILRTSRNPTLREIDEILQAIDRTADPPLLNDSGQNPVQPASNKGGS